MFQSFVSRWRTLSTVQQVIIGMVGALAAYYLFVVGDMFSPERLLAIAAILLIALPVHELAHAAAATWLGDDTPRLQGRMTLNPLAHLDPMGAILILLTGFGWAKPVQWNPRNVRGDVRTASIVISLAGPMSNLLMATAAMAALSFFGLTAPAYVSGFLYWFASINVLLAVFNLIPVPPLDGSHVLFALIPGDTRMIRRQLSQYGMLFIFLVVFLMPSIIRTPTNAVMSLLERLFLGAALS